MSKPFDATVKELLERDPSAWLNLAGYPGQPAEIIDADVSTVTAASDKVIRVHGNPDWLLDINFQRGPDSTLPRRVHLYGVVLSYRHELRTRSLVVLLTPKANLSNLTGTYEEAFPGDPPHMYFRYQVMRVWQIPADRLVECGLGTLPLAPLGAITEDELPGVISLMRTHLNAEVQPTQQAELWTAAYVLMGLRYDGAVVDRVLSEVMTMEESTTYQAIIRRGMARDARQILFLQGQEKFGPAPESVRRTIEGLDDVDHLHQLAVRLLKAASWDDLLAVPVG